MIKIKFIWMLLISLSLLFGQWQALGPYGGNLRCVVVSYTNDNIVYAGSNASPTIVAKSTNGGTNWTTMGSIPNQAYCMAIDPTMITDYMQEVDM